MRVTLILDLRFSKLVLIARHQRILIIVLLLDLWHLVLNRSIDLICLKVTLIGGLTLELGLLVMSTVLLIVAHAI